MDASEVCLPVTIYNIVWLKKKYFMLVEPTKNKDDTASFVDAAFCCFSRGGTITVKHVSTIALFL